MVFVLVNYNLHKKPFLTNYFFDFYRDLYKSIGNANHTVITPIMNPTGKKNAITRKIGTIVRQTQATHSQKIF